MSNSNNLNAVKVTAVSFSLLAGVTGIISGIGLMRQGDIPPSSLWVSMIGSGYDNYLDSAYSVMTIVPSFYWSGVLAILLSTLSIVWAIKFLQNPAGSSVMMILVIAQTLVGGGWVLDLGLFTSLLAKGIDSPLYWWEKRIPTSTRVVLSRFWWVSVITYGILSCFLLGFTLLGVNDSVVLGTVDDIATLMILPCLWMVLGGISREIQKKEYNGESWPSQLTQYRSKPENKPKDKHTSVS